MFVVNRNRFLQFVPLSCRAAAHQASHLLSPCLNKKTARCERLRDSSVFQLNLRRSDVALGWMPTSTTTVTAAETLRLVVRLHCNLTPSLPRALCNSQALRHSITVPKVRPVASRFRKRLLAPPSGDFGVIAADQHLGDRPPAKIRRPRVVRKIQQQLS